MNTVKGAGLFLQKDKEEKEEKKEHPMGWGRYAPPASFHNDPALAEGEKQSVAPLSSANIISPTFPMDYHDTVV